MRRCRSPKDQTTARPSGRLKRRAVESIFTPFSRFSTSVFALIAIAEVVRGQRQQSARVGIQLVAIGPEVVESFCLELADVRLLSRDA